MSGKLKKGIVVIFIANIINLALSTFRNLILPRYLSVETYAEIKTYQLYISHISFAALGYIDGMYLKYGGCRIDHIDKKELFKSIASFRWIELGLSIIISIIGFILNDIFLVLTGITIIAVNVADYYKCLFQATGEFQNYSRLMNVSSILVFAISLFLVFILKTDNSIHYIFGYISIYYFVWICIELIVARKMRGTRVFLFSFETTRESIQSGFLLMCGLTLSSLMTALDRWCVKFTLPNVDFAMYAFAASIEGFLSYGVSPISITLYNYFCKSTDIKKNMLVKDEIEVFLSVLISGAFVVRFIMESYLQKYLPAVNVLFILFAGQFVYGIIKCFYLNLFKAQKKQKMLFNLTAIILVIGLILNISLFFLFRNMEAFSWGTLISALIWYIICERIFNEYKDSIAGYIYILIIIVAYTVCGLMLKSYFGFILYTPLSIFVSYLFKREAVRDLMRIVKTSIGNHIKRLKLARKED